MKRLKVEDGEVLHGFYASEVKQHCDVENIVLYNVGPGHFASATRNGIRIERSFHAGPDSPEQLAEHPKHYLAIRCNASMRGSRRGRQENASPSGRLTALAVRVSSIARPFGIR
ncbi:MAG: hypothetical protein M3552_02680 [Planctomycetota bacterium]|nr:hypothetical protein [Planctomycetaceae bacterium]MDQ3329552.1 hypothetical protein [Planctomycetota bacterium]